MGHSRQEVWNTEEKWDAEEVWTTEDVPLQEVWDTLGDTEEVWKL